MATFTTGTVTAISYLLENRSSWSHSSHEGRLRWQFTSRDAAAVFPTGQAWWAQRTNADGDRYIAYIDLEEDRVRINLGSKGGGNTKADLSSDFETKGEFGIKANGQLFRIEMKSQDLSEIYNIAPPTASTLRIFIENHIISRNPYRDDRDVRDVEFVFWDGNGQNPFVKVDAVAPTVGVNAIPTGDERTTVQVSATETGGIYDAIARTWAAAKGTIVKDVDDNTKAQWTRPSVTAATEDFKITYAVTVVGSGTNAKASTNDSATASHTATVRNVRSAATAPETVIIDVAKVIDQDAGYKVKLSATLTGGTYDKAEFQWRIKHNGYTPVRDLTATALDAADLTEPTLTYPDPATGSSNSEIEVELSVSGVGTGTLADNNTSAVKSATPITFKTWKPVALPEWAIPPLGVLDSDDVQLASAQEEHEVRLFAIRKADTGQFDDVEIDWEYSKDADEHGDFSNFINLDDEVDDDPFVWTLPKTDADLYVKIRARFRVSGSGTNARNGTQTGWSAWREELFQILTFHVQPTNYTVSVAHNSGSIRGGEVFDSESTIVATAHYSTAIGNWDTREVSWGYILNNSAVTNAATSVTDSSAVITMPEATAETGDLYIDVYLEIIWRGTGVKARAGTSVTTTEYRRDVAVVYLRPLPVLPTSWGILSNPSINGNEGEELTITFEDDRQAGITWDERDVSWVVSIPDPAPDIEAEGDSITFTRPSVTADSVFEIFTNVIYKGTGRNYRFGAEISASYTEYMTVFNVPSGIKLGLTAIDKIRLGETAVAKIRLGDTLIFSA